MSHRLHKAVADALGTAVSDHYTVLKDPACGGDQHLPLFLHKEKSRAHKLCNVDALVLLDGRLKVIVEIEETNIKPTQICGKFLTSALAQYFTHANTHDTPIEKADAVLFLQVVDSTKLKDKSRKIKQFAFLEESIRTLLSGIQTSHITDYHLIPVKGCEDQKGMERVATVVKEFCAKTG